MYTACLRLLHRRVSAGKFLSNLISCCQVTKRDTYPLSQRRRSLQHFTGYLNEHSRRSSAICFMTPAWGHYRFSRTADTCNKQF